MIRIECLEGSTMILAMAVVLGLAASLIRHREHAFGRIAAIPLHSAWLVLLAVALQLPLLRSPMAPTEHLGIQQALFLASHLLLLAFVWRNRRLTGIQIAGLGVICNLLVVLVNGGFMPITPQTLVQINPGRDLAEWTQGLHYGFSKDIILLRQDTNLWGLSDILVIPPPFPWPTAFSLGDLIIAVGIVVLLQAPDPIPSLVSESARSS